MNKKFLSAIMFGALMTASTGVFVSCEDYGDDIAHLQEQIDQNAAAADSELAAKVAALQSQLSTLEAAQESLKEQLATAKAEAATAANNALAAAQAAQAAADKAQGGADDAKAAAAAAQAAADKANQALSDAVARVAVLESKVASLEATIAELSAASKDLNAKLAEVQTLASTLKNSTDKNAADVAALVKQVADLNAELGKVSSTLGARIDAVDAQLNEIKATFDKYVTKSELQAKADVLANMDAQLQLQIQTNLNYIKEMQAAIASLGEKDKELAATIEKNYADVMAEIEELATSQAEALATLEAAVKAGDAKLDEAIKAVQAIAETNAAAIKDIQATLATKADKTAVDALAKDLAQAMTDIADITADLAAYKAEVADELASINASIEDLYDLAAQIAQSAQANYADIAALRELTAEQILDIQDMLAQLSQTVTSNYLYSVSIEEKLEEHLTVIYDQLAQLSQTVISNYKEIVKNKEEIYNLQVTIGDHEVRLGDMEEVVASLVSLANSNYQLIVANQEEIQNLKDELASTMTEIAEWQEAFEAKYETLVSDTQAQIDAELAKLTALSENLNVLNADVTVLKEQMAAVLGRIQSIAFVPEYMNANGNVIVPVYYYNQEEDIVGGDFKATPINVKFRVQPAEAAEALAQLYTSEKGKACFKLEYANQLQTRATAAGYAVSNVQNAGNGMIVVTGVTADATDYITEGTYAYTLVVEDTSVTKKTSDYFNVETQAINLENVTIKHADEGRIQFTDFSLYNPARDITVNYITKASVEPLVLKELGRNPKLRIEAVKVGNEYVSLWADTYKNNKGAIYDNNQKNEIKKSLENFWKNDDNAKYYVPITSANNNVQVKGLETGKVVDKYGIDHSIKLMIVDTSFGRSNTADENTSGWNTNFGWVKVYEVEHVITPNATATSLYDFNVEGTKLAWRNVDGKKDQTVYAADGLEWLKYGISSSPALQPGDAEGVIDIKTISYDLGVSASVDQVTEELAAAIADGNTTELTFNNKTYGTVTFSVEKKTVKAVVSFNEGIPYGATYSFSKEYDTAFGKITLKGIVKLTINGETQDDMLEHTRNWKPSDPTAYNLGTTNPRELSKDQLYVPDWQFSQGYMNWAKWTNEENCTYEWYLLPELVNGGTLTAVPNINSVSSTKSTVVLEDASTTVEGYLFNGGKIWFDRYISATYRKDKVDDTVKGSEALAQLRFITVVKDWNGNVVAHEYGKFNYVDPIVAPDIANIQFTADQCLNIVNEPLVICQGINVIDVHNETWYTDGVLDEVTATVWGAKDIVYTIDKVTYASNPEKEVSIDAVAGDLYIDATDKAAVKIVFNDYQWADDLQITVKASIEYTYGLVEDVFVVTLPANPILQ